MSKEPQGYKKIKVGPSDEPESIIDVQLEDVTTAPHEEDEGVEVDISDTPNKEDLKKEPKVKDPETKEEEVVTKKKKAEDKPPQEEARTSRARKRIKQLHSEKTELQQKLELAEQQKALLQQQLLEGTKQSKESMKTALETNLSTLTGALKEAIEDGNSDEVVRLQDEMINAKMQLAGIQSELSKIPEKVEQPKKKPAQQQNDIPERALEWIEDHPQFKTDELFYVASLTVSNQLVSEGFDDQSEDFYEELNTRLSPRFPEVFGNSNKNSVQLEEDNKNASDEDEDGKTNTSNTTDEDSDEEEYTPAEQTVSGASRTPPHKKGKKSTRGNDSVVLSPQMVKQAERWGLSLEQMARRVAHSEKNKKGDGYVPILMKK